jgi:precorrin-2 methylase
MRKIYLIGIGAGNPEYITMQAIKALNLVDVFFFMDKGEAKQDLVNLRKEICERYIEKDHTELWRPQIPSAIQAYRTTQSELRYGIVSER